MSTAGTLSTPERPTLSDQQAHRRVSYPWGAASLVAAAAVIASLPTVTGGFFWDTPAIKDGLSLFIPFFEHLSHRPVMWLSIDLDRILWGNWSPGYHIVNLMVHAANSVLLMFISRRLGLGQMASAVAAGLFALHPVNMEAVGWVLGRAWVLGAFFSLTAFLLYLKYVASRVTAAAVSSSLFFLLALLAGQGALALLPLVVLHAGIVRLERKRALLVVLLYVLSVLVYQYFFRGTGGLLLRGMFSSSTGGIFDALAALGFYLFGLILPAGIRPLPIMNFSVIFSIAGIVPLFALYVLSSEGLRREAAVLGALVVLMAPGLLVSLGEGSFPLGYRYMYLPAAAFCVLVSQLLEHVKKPGIKNAVIMLLMAAYAAGTFAGAIAWADQAGLWREAAERYGNKAMLHVNHGATLILSGDHKAGEDSLSRALASDDVSDDHFVLIRKLYELAGQDGEIQMYEAMVGTRGKALAEYVMGFIYYRRYFADKTDIENLRRAVEFLKRAVAENDNLYRAYYYLGLSYLEAREFEKAFGAFESARERDVDNRYTEEITKTTGLINSLRSIGFENIPALPGW